MNKVYGYEVGFPGGWDTQQLSPDQACRWFDPQRFQLVPASEAPFTALAIYPSRETYDEAVGGSVNPGVFRVLLREDLTILGRRGVRLEIQATGTGPLPEGILLYRYIVDMGDRGIFVVETTMLAPSDYASNKAIVDQIVQTLQFTR